MTIPFEKLKARLLANPKVKAKYDALAPEFEIAAELLRARLRVALWCSSRNCDQDERSRAAVADCTRQYRVETIMPVWHNMPYGPAFE